MVLLPPKTKLDMGHEMKVLLGSTKTTLIL